MATYGVPPGELADIDLEREVAHLHETRHDTFRNASEDALERTPSGCWPWRRNTFAVSRSALHRTRCAPGPGAGTLPARIEMTRT